MHWIDWMILGSFVVGLTALAVYTKQYTRSVADFLVASRCAGRYMISILSGSFVPLRPLPRLERVKHDNRTHYEKAPMKPLNPAGVKRIEH